MKKQLGGIFISSNKTIFKDSATSLNMV